MAFKLESFMADTTERTVFKRAAFLAGTAVVLSAATIIFFNSALVESQLDSMTAGIQLLAITLFPYMLSAVIAAITAIAVMSMVPSARLSAPTESVRERLEKLTAGDLASKLGIKPKAPQMQALVAELNLATTTIGHNIANWKMINRQQWELLETMREITVVSGQAQMIKVIEQMEKNWEKIAEIEALITT